MGSWWKWALGIAGVGAGTGALIAHEALRDDDVVMYPEPTEMASDVRTDPAFSDMDRARFEGGGALPPAVGNDGDGPKDDDCDWDGKEDKGTLPSDVPGTFDKKRFEERAREMWPDESSVGDALEVYGIKCSSVIGNARNTGMMYAMRAGLAAGRDLEDLPEEHQERVRSDLDYLESTGLDMDDVLSRIGSLPFVHTESSDQWYDGASSVRGFLCRKVFIRAFYNGMREFRDTHDPQDLEGLRSVIRLLDEGRKSWVDPRELLMATEEVSSHVNSYVMNYVRSKVDQIVRLRDEGNDDRAYFMESGLHDYLNMLSGCETGSKKRVWLLTNENYRGERLITNFNQPDQF
jgi:hypothetical protein